MRPVLRGLGDAVLSTVLMGAALLGPAHAWRAPRVWALIAVYFVVHVVGLTRVVRANPDLLRERAKPPLQRGQPFADRVLLLGLMASYAAMLVVTGLDAARWNLAPVWSAGLAWAGMGLFAAGWVLVMRALEANAFAATVVRHQAERRHAVVTTDVYGIVRHPMYAGLLAAILGVPLWLRSGLGLLVALAPIGLLVVRIYIEERVLRHALPEYAAYAARVRARLLPGVW